jgi:hypothetical protein
MQPIAPETAPKTGNCRFHPAGSSGYKTAEAGGSPRVDVQNLRLHFVHGAIDERFFLTDRFAIHRKAFGKKRRRAHHNVGLRHGRFGV